MCACPEPRPPGTLLAMIIRLEVHEFMRFYSAAPVAVR
jgi:hypothetical protein